MSFHYLAFIRFFLTERKVSLFPLPQKLLIVGTQIFKSCANERKKKTTKREGKKVTWARFLWGYFLANLIAKSEKSKKRKQAAVAKGAREAKRKWEHKKLAS